jgi:hypothetical protein
VFQQTERTRSIILDCYVDDPRSLLVAFFRSLNFLTLKRNQRDVSLRSELHLMSIRLADYLRNGRTLTYLVYNRVELQLIAWIRRRCVEYIYTGADISIMVLCLIY